MDFPTGLTNPTSRRLFSVLDSWKGLVGVLSPSPGRTVTPSSTRDYFSQDVGSQPRHGPGDRPPTVPPGRASGIPALPPLAFRFVGHFASRSGDLRSFSCPVHKLCRAEALQEPRQAPKPGTKPLSLPSDEPLISGCDRHPAGSPYPGDLFLTTPFSPLFS